MKKKSDLGKRYQEVRLISFPINEPLGQVTLIRRPSIKFDAGTKILTIEQQVSKDIKNYGDQIAEFLLEEAKKEFDGFDYKNIEINVYYE